MILKTAGLCVLALVCVITGVYFGRKEKAVARDLMLTLDLLRHLEREISYRRADLPDCFESFFAQRSHPCADGFLRGDSKGALEALALPRAVRAELAGFFGDLGKGEAAEEQNRLRAMTDLVARASESAGKDAAQRQRAYVTLGVCAGAVLLLMFL